MHSLSLQKPVHPSVWWKEEPCPIIINTYFRVFPSSPTHSLASQTIGLLMAHHSATLFALKQIAISLLPSRGTIHIYFLLRELPPPSCVGAICCFLLLWLAFIHFQHSLNAAIVRCWNAPKERNKDGEQKDDFLAKERKATKEDAGNMAAFRALVDTWRNENVHFMSGMDLICGNHDTKIKFLHVFFPNCIKKCC